LELYDDGDIFSIDELVLDESKLSSIDYRERKLFYLAEKPSVLLIHVKIVEQITSASLSGIRFFMSSVWNSDTIFD
jgi:hypothetical protein